LKSIFARFGIPETVVSDNGPQYSSEEFQNFSKEFDFKHVTSSPNYPQSNGLAEKYVQIAKRILEKAKHSKQDPHLALLEYRVTPLDIGYSPSQLLQGRHLRSILPTVSDNLKPQYINHEKVRSAIMASKTRQKHYYDKRSKTPKPMEVGNSVRFQKDSKLWKPAKVIGKENDRSLVIQAQNGAIYRRNRRHIIKSNESVYDTPMIPLCTDQPAYDPTNLKILQDINPVSPPCEPPKISSQPKLDIGQSNMSKPYITRSGRAVKPKTIISM
ncbi:hypothetical protein FSP39_023406, partial [Pinctada imbricata]